MTNKDMRAGVKGRSGYRTVTYRGTRGRSFNALVTTRTSGTSLTLKIRSGAYRPSEAATAKATTQAKVADTWVNGEKQ